MKMRVRALPAFRWLLALGLALVARIREAYGTIEEDDILLQETSAGSGAA